MEEWTRKNPALWTQIAWALAGSLLLLFCAPPEAEGDEPGKNIRLVTKEISLGKVHNSIVGSVRVSPDSKHVAYAAKRGGKQLVVVDGEEGKEYDKISGRTIIFSPDSKHLAYRASRGGKQLMVVDGREGKEYDKINYLTIVFSPDSKHLAYSAVRRKKHILVLDGKEGKEYDKIWGSVFIGRKGKRTGYVARRGRRVFVVIDGVERKGYGSMEGYLSRPSPLYLLFSPDGKRVAYHLAYYTPGRALPVRGKPVMVRGPLRRKEVIVVDGKEYDWTGKGRPVFSPDAKRVVYVGKRGSKEVLVVDGKEGKEYDKIWSIGFSPDSKHVGYRASRSGKQLMVVDGREGKKYDKISDIFFSPDGKRAAYWAQRGSKWLVVVDGKEGKEYDEIIGHGWIIFTLDGKRVGYRARRGNKALIVIDGVEGKEYDGAGDPVFSRDGKRVGYVGARGRKRLLVVDGVDGKEYDGVGDPVFSRDGKRVAYVAARGRKRLLVVDGLEGKEYDSLSPGDTLNESKLVWDARESLHTVAVRNNEHLRVEIRIANGTAKKPTYAEINKKIEEIALEKKIPPIIIKAICYRESRWRQYGGTEPKWEKYREKTNDPTGKVTFHPEFDENDRPVAFGYGLMQVTVAPGNSKVRRLCNDWEYNLRQGVAVLLEKWSKNETPRDEDRYFLEKWFYPIAWYNGWGKRAYDYVQAVYDLISKPPLIGGRNYWKPVAIASPAEAKKGFNDKTIKKTGNTRYHLSQLPRVHKWNGKIGKELRYSRIANIPSTQPAQVIPATDGAAEALSRQAQGKSDGSIQAPIKLLNVGTSIPSLAFSPDGQTLAAGG